MTVYFSVHARKPYGSASMQWCRHALMGRCSGVETETLCSGRGDLMDWHRVSLSNIDTEDYAPLSDERWSPERLLDDEPEPKEEDPQQPPEVRHLSALLDILTERDPESVLLLHLWHVERMR